MDDRGTMTNTSTERRLSKLYADLTSREKGTLAFARIARLDKTEVERIEATVPWRTYRMLDSEYHTRIDRLGHLAFFWGTQHWRMRTAVAAAFGLVNLACSTENEEAFERAIEMFRKAEGQLLGLDRILVELCEAAGVDVSAMRILTATPEVYESVGLPFCDPIPDPEYEAEMREIMSKLVE